MFQVRAINPCALFLARSMWKQQRNSEYVKDDEVRERVQHHLAGEWVVEEQEDSFCRRISLGMRACRFVAKVRRSATP